MMKLTRTLDLSSYVSVIVGAVLGSGIFLVPGTILRQSAGQPLVAFLAWSCGGVVSLLGALTYAELCVRNPTAGGIYAYIRDAFGLLPAFLYGWALFFVLGSGAVAALSVAFSSYLAEIVPMSDVQRRIAAAGMIGFIAVVNILGTRWSAILQKWSTSFKVLAITLLIAVLVCHGQFSTNVIMYRRAGALGSVSGFGVAMISVLWAYEGWQYCTFSAGEVISPQTTIPRSLVISIVGVSVIFILSNWGYLSVLGIESMQASPNVATDAFRSLGIRKAAEIISVLIVVAVVSSANGIILTSSRVYYAMARDGVFFRRMGQINITTETPVFAVLATSIWSMVLAVSGTFEELLILVVSTGWIFYGLAAASVFRYDRRSNDGAGLYRIPWFPWSTLLFIASAIYMVVSSGISKPRQTIFGVGVLAVGIPVFVLWRRIRQNEGQVLLMEEIE